MNAQQRKTIQAAIDTLSAFTDADHCKEQGVAAVIDAVSNARSVFTEEAEAEREKFDNMPEGLQQTEKGEKLEEAADQLESADSSLEEVDLSEHVTPEEGWADDVAEQIQTAIDEAEAAL